MKIYFNSLLIFCLFLLSACAPDISTVPRPAPAGPSSTTEPPAAPTQAATQPIAVQPIPSATRVQRTRPTATQPVEKARADDPLNIRNQPTWTPVIPTPTPVPTLYSPDLVWGELGQAQILPYFFGQWSPTANELAGVVAQKEPAVFTVTRGPEFALQKVRLPTEDFFGVDTNEGVNLTWSPDGRWIIFPGPNNADGTWTGAQDYLPWRVDHHGQNLEPLAGGGQFLRFFSWMDARTLLIGGYTGGGHWWVERVDVWAKEAESLFVLHGPIFPPHAEYIPFVVSYASSFHLTVYTPELQLVERRSQWMDEGAEHSRAYPGTDVYQAGGQEAHWARIFKTWLPGTNRMILLEYVQADWADLTQLYQLSIQEWNLDTDETHLITPMGVDAFASADGKLLAITTVDNTVTDQDGVFQVDDRQPLLNLMDVESQQVLLQLPVVSVLSEPSEMLDGIQLYYATSAAFSPDSRFLAFLSTGTVGLDVDGMPDGTITPGANRLNILDLQARQILFSTPAVALASWSPRSNRLVYQKEDGNWHLYDLGLGKELAITQSGGYSIADPAWSFSGSYLSFVIPVSEPTEEYKVPVQHTAILTLPE